MKIVDYKVGLGVKWKGNIHEKSPFGQYGVILSVGDNNIVVCEVKRIDSFTVCYDDPCATEENKDNVRLKNCPPPFVELCEEQNGCYAIADANKLIRFDSRQITNVQLEVIDNGKCVLEEDMCEIIKHAKIDEQPQKEKVNKGREIPYIDCEDESNKGSELDL